MKFSHSIQFNSVPDWADKYIAYSNLKKAVYALEKDQPLESAGIGAVPSYSDDYDTESSALIRSGQTSDSDRIFAPLLDKELNKIVSFYMSKEAELQRELRNLEADLVRIESEEMPEESDDGSDDDDEEDYIDSPATTMKGTTRRKSSNGGAAKGSLREIFTDPRRYNEAARHERQLRSSRRLSRNSDDAEMQGAGSQLIDVLQEPTAAETSVPDVMAISAERPRRPRTASQIGSTSNPQRWSLFRKGSQRQPLGIVTANLQNEETGQLSASRSEFGVDSSIAGDKSMSVWTAENDFAIDIRITFKKRITDLFVSMSELKQFVQLNETGMKKIVKKYDKTMNSNLKTAYMNEVVLKQPPFTAERRQALDENITTLTELYAKVVTSGDVAEALEQLKTHLREQVVWQRNTVWREMIGIERRAQGASLERAVAKGKSEAAKPVRVWTPFGRATLPTWFGIPTLQLAIAFTLLVLLLKAPGLRFFGRVEEQNCLAMLVFCTILWATEVIPLFVTSLMVPLLVVTLRVGRTDDIEDRRMTANETTKWIFSQMFAPNMCLLLGGFTLAAALSKYGIDKVLAQKILRLAGTRPSFVLLAHMGVACFASMWISNVAAPVLMYSLIQPILRNLPPNSPYASSLIMGIALASNIGGQTSPIASPQNLIALQYMDIPVGWLQWFAITIPVSGLSLIIIWVVLLWSYGSGRGTTIKRMAQNNDDFSRIQWFISGVSVATILLWCFERQMEHVVGDMGVIAIIPLVCFFGTGILTKEDFNNFLWTIVFLAMGGIALGKAVTSSGLLESMDHLIQGVVQGMPLWKVLFSLLALSLVVATFISHTIAAVLLVPIAAQVGESLADPHPRLLIMATTLTASAAMGLPVSGFPNMTAVSMENDVGQRYVTVKDFLRVGVLASVLATLVVGTLGFLIMLTLKL